MRKLRERLNTSFYIRYNNAYEIVNAKDGRSMIFYTEKGSPWMNNFAAAERWVRQQENDRENLDNIERLANVLNDLSFFFAKPSLDRFE